jgi:uncharacterized protein YabE (DUF348 family)
MFKRSKLGFVISGFVLAGVLLAGGVALSQKTVNVATRPGCDNAPALEKASKAVSQIIESGRWTNKDHDQIRPLLHFLHTEQKIELMRKVAAAIQAKKLVLEKGAHLFY